MKIQTAELTGAALDYAVALAEGLPCKAYIHGTECWIYVSPSGHEVYSPSSGIEGDEIIDRWMIATQPTGIVAWGANLQDENGKGFFGNGPTRRIAAMRCFVCSRLGKEVEIPQGQP